MQERRYECYPCVRVLTCWCALRFTDDDVTRHLHSDEFRVFEEGAMGYGLPPMLVSSAVTPVYGNNPSFKVLHYDPDTKAIVGKCTSQTMPACVPACISSSYQHAYEMSSVLTFANLDPVMFCRLRCVCCTVAERSSTRGRNDETRA